jgi:phosphate transport system protein
MRQGFQQELGAIERRLLRDVDLASATLRGLSDVVSDPSRPTPGYIEADAERMRDSGRITHERLVVAAAREAPVATDLRLVLAFFHINKHLALVANQFELLTEQLMEMDPEEMGSPQILERLGRMASHASLQLTKAGESLATRDVVKAQSVGHDDDALDLLNREVFAEARSVSGPVGRRELALHQMLMARSLERVGDNAVDIAEQVAYIVTGEYREFADASRPKSVEHH